MNNPLDRVRIDVSSGYDVLIGRGLLDRCGELLSPVIPPCKAAVVTDSTVNNIYSDRVVASLDAGGYTVCKTVFPAGESSKNVTNYTRILEFLAENRLTRSDIVVALGGGVTGDMAGFAAATYLRGIHFVQIPTTLLAASDSSVGGKTGVDLSVGKNLVGAFHQPSLVLCDCDTFASLPPGAVADGLAETLKHGLIADRDFLFDVIQGAAKTHIESVVRRNVEIKRDFVRQDEFDKGLRQHLNFGHTVGHAVEKSSGYTISHGYAVAIGMAVVTRIADAVFEPEEVCLPTVLDALAACGLPHVCAYKAEELFDAITGDKKRLGDNINLIYLNRLGQSRSKKVPVSQLPELLKIGLDGD